jgi:signal transduction histidine kinase
LSAGAEAGKAIILVTNRCAANAPAHAGMGVGTLVARAIVEAHGGRLTIVRDGADVRAVVTLPLIGAEA